MIQSDGAATGRTPALKNLLPSAGSLRAKDWRCGGTMTAPSHGRCSFAWMEVRQQHHPQWYAIDVYTPLAYIPRGRRLAEGTSMRKELFDELLQSVKEMKEIQTGRLKPSRIVHAADLVLAGTPNVAGLRARFKLSQVKFAALLGISVDTLQNWEQKRRQPDGPAKVLLRIARTHPEALLAATPAPVDNSIRGRRRRNGLSPAPAVSSTPHPAASSARARRRSPA